MPNAFDVLMAGAQQLTAREKEASENQKRLDEQQRQEREEKHRQDHDDRMERWSVKELNDDGCMACGMG